MIKIDPVLLKEVGRKVLAFLLQIIIADFLSKKRRKK
jgi:hypothetical protein